MTISYYEKMADGKLHCLDNQLPFELPDGWEWCNLSMIGTTNIGLTYRPTDIEPGGIMVLRSCNIVNDQVDLSGLVRVKTTVRENNSRIYIFFFIFKSILLINKPEYQYPIRALLYTP